MTRTYSDWETALVTAKNATSSSDELAESSGRRSLREEVRPFASSPSDAPERAKLKPISAKEFDQKFDDGADIDEYIDWSSATRPNLVPKRVNVDFPLWMVTRLDRRAQELGITRQALIKMWIADRLEASS